MAKKILELKHFMKGIISSPSDSDIPEDAAVYSENIDAISEEGKIKGAKDDLEISDSDSSIANLEIFDSSNTGNTASPLEEDYKYTLYINNEKLTSHTISATESNYLTYTANQMFCEILEASSKITSAEPLPFKDFSDDVESEFTETGAIQTCLATDPQIETNDTPENYDINVGEMLKLERQTDNEFEIVKVTGVVNDAQEAYIIVDRGQDDTTALAFDDDDKIYKQYDYNAMKITFSGHPVDIRIEIEDETGATIQTYNSIDQIETIDISPKNFIVTSSKEEDAVKTTTDIIFYDQNLTDEKYEMKVFENFYSENGGTRQLIEGPSEGAWSLENSLTNVSLDAGPNAVYIGTGNLSSSDSKWFGKIEHEQFGDSFEGYHLEDARIEAIDEGNTIFSMNQMEHPVYAELGATPTVDRKEEGLLGTSPSSRKAIWIKNMKATGTNASANEALLGKQIASNDLGMYPGGICTSPKVTKALSTTGLGSSGYDPWVNSWDTTNDWTDHDETINGHLLNEVLADDADDYVKQTYAWMSEKTGYDTIYLYAIRYIDDRNVTMKTISRRLGYFKLNF